MIIDGVPSAPSPKFEFTGAYEHLRLAATDSSTRTAGLQGLGILIRKGMAAWMQACSLVPPPPTVASSTTSDNVVQILPSVQRAVVDVLAAMALTITPEVRT